MLALIIIPVDNYLYLLVIVYSSIAHDSAYIVLVLVQYHQYYYYYYYNILSQQLVVASRTMYTAVYCCVLPLCTAGVCVLLCTGVWSYCLLLLLQLPVLLATIHSYTIVLYYTRSILIPILILVQQAAGSSRQHHVLEY